MWLLQLANREKRRVTTNLENCLIELFGQPIKVNLNMFPLGSYDFLIGMDWLDQHHAILYCHKNTFTCLDEEGSLNKMRGIPRAVTIR